jgi:hypothetical protein
LTQRVALLNYRQLDHVINPFLLFYSQLTENHDLIFDDGVAPEMAIDFDCQHISTGEAILTTSAMFGFLAVVFQLIKATDPEGQNPAVNRTVMNMVVEAPKTGKAFFDPV